MVLDVWENEPHINLQLLEKSIISTSHIAGYSADGKWNGTVGSIQRVSEYFGFKDIESRIQRPLLPINPIIEIECGNRSLEDIFSEVILKTYSIEADSDRLKFNTNNFETLRNKYPNRREFDSYTLRFRNDLNNYLNIFSSLGFKTNGYV